MLIIARTAVEKHWQGQVHLLRSHTPKGPPGHPISNKLVIEEKEFAKLRPVVVGDIAMLGDGEGSLPPEGGPRPSAGGGNPCFCSFSAELAVVRVLEAGSLESRLVVFGLVQPHNFGNAQRLEYSDELRRSERAVAFHVARSPESQKFSRHDHVQVCT